MRPECEVPGCTDLVWGSEPVCRMHLLAGVTGEKVERRRQLQEAARDVATGDLPTVAVMHNIAIEAGVAVPSSATKKRLGKALKDAAVEIANSPDPATPDPDVIRAAQVDGVPDSAAVMTKENTDG